MQTTDPNTVSHLGADDKDLKPGQKVGEYVVEEKIGEGGFGTVFRASHPLIGKVVAIKVLNRQYSAQPEMVSRFVAEARAVNQIRHRNIIDIFAFGTIEDGRHYYVMEFLEGCPLDEQIEQAGHMSLGEAIPILRAIARALDAAHGKGIAHRDLKPENVFLVREPDGTVFPKLLDFGIAKLMSVEGGGGVSHKTRTGAPIGTPYYMSPEQCRGRDVDHRTDIYAFGIMAYKILTGEVPFDGEDYMDILLKQIGEEPPAPSSRVPELPPSVDQGVAWMLKKDPSERPPNLVTAVRALEDAAVAAGIAVPSTPQTGVYATSTSRVAAQRTPSTVTPLPRGPSRDIGNAATMAAGDSGLVNVPTMAAGATVGATVGAAPTAAGLAAVPPPKSKVGLFVLAAFGAIAVGATVFFLLRDRPADGIAAGEHTNDPGSALAGASGSSAASGSVSPATLPDAAAAPPPVDAAAAQTATLPGLPRFVTIEVSGPPKGTDVYAPTGPLGVAPGPIQLPRGESPILLTFKSDGYITATASVTPSEDGAIDVAMERKGGTKGGGTKGGGTKGGKGDGTKGDGKGDGNRNTIEDPFKTGG